MAIREDLNKAINIKSNSGEAHATRGLIYYEKGNSEKAIKKLEKAATLFKNQEKIRKYKDVQELLKQIR